MKIRSAVLMLIGAVSMLSIPAVGQPDFGRYIVTLKDGADSNALSQRLAKQAGGKRGYVYSSALNGFSIEMPKAALNGLRNHPKVILVEEDLAQQAIVQGIPEGITRIFASQNTDFDIDGVDDNRVDADVAILDTGIDVDHPDLNVVGGANCLQSRKRRGRTTYYCDATVSADDDQYHGTHVAGTVAALDNGVGVVGVAPGARLWAVKVLDSNGSGYTSGIIAGIDWVVAQGDIEVMNLSLGGSGVSSAYQTAIDNAVANGVAVVVAAGNSAADSANYSPAFVRSAITVSALADFDGLEGGNGTSCYADDTEQDDTLADFSNFGVPVDIAAPGYCVYSTIPTEYAVAEPGYYSLDGTSMAAPHVAGAAAVLASNGMAASDIAGYLTSTGNFNYVDDSGDGIQEPLLDVSSLVPRFVGGEPPPPPPPPPAENVAPTAEIAINCGGLTCTFDASGSSDSDGTITSYAWNFGDGTAGSGESTTHSYTQPGTYSVTLTVTDDDGATDNSSGSATATDPGTGGGPTLEASIINSGKNWTMRVVNSDGSLLSGTFSTGTPCSNESVCSSTQRKKVSSVTFTRASDGESVTVVR
jgi:subtilisin family serine protease